MERNETRPVKPEAPRIVLAGVGRHGSSIVHDLSGFPAAVEKLFVTASPVQAVAESPSLLRVRGRDNWRDQLKGRLAGARMVVTVAAVNCREGSFSPELLAAGRAEGALSVAVLVEPLIAGSPHWGDGSDHVMKEVVKSADATIVVPGDLHPPATLSISEAMDNWNRRLAAALRGLLLAAAADDAMNMDFTDLASVLSAHSRATVGCGKGRTVEEALQDAGRQSLALSAELETACSALAYVTVSGEMSLDDARRAGAVLEQLFPKAETRCGIAVDTGLTDVRATIIAGKLDIDAARSAARKRTSQTESPFFTVGDPTVYDGENLDVPAFIRKDVILPGGPPRPVPAQRTLFEAASAPSV